jgi:cytochrome c556
VKHRILGAAALAAIAGIAYAQSPAADRIRARQANYKQMAAATKGIADQLRGGSPDLAAIRRGRALIANHASRIPDWFPHGTGPEARVRTRARPEVWTDPAGFRRAAFALFAAARSLYIAARHGDAAAVRTAFPAVRRACSDCHDDYRAPEH